MKLPRNPNASDLQHHKTHLHPCTCVESIMVNIHLVGAHEASSGIRFPQTGSTAWSRAKLDWREILTETMFDCAWSSKIPLCRRLGVWKQVSVKPIINLEHSCSSHSAPRPYYCHCLTMLLAVLHAVCKTQVRLIQIQIVSNICSHTLKRAN